MEVVSTVKDARGRVVGQRMFDTYMKEINNLIVNVVQVLF